MKTLFNSSFYSNILAQEFVTNVLQWYDGLLLPVIVVNDHLNILNLNSSAESFLKLNNVALELTSTLQIETEAFNSSLKNLIQLNDSFRLSGKLLPQKNEYFQGDFVFYPVLNSSSWLVFIETNIVPTQPETVLLETLLLNTKDVIIITSSRFEVINFNTRAAEFYGFDIHSIDGQNDGLCWLDPNQKYEFLQHTLPKLVNGIYQNITTINSKSGQVYKANLRITPIKHEHSLAYFIIQLEIIRNISTEQLISASQKRYFDFIKHTQALICTHDIHGKILSVNPASLKALGYDHERELVDKSLSILFDNKDLGAFQQYIANIKQNGEASGVMRVVGRSRNIMYWVYKNYLVKEEGISYVVGSAQDISDRILVEKELKKAKILAENALKTREQFLANVSHELRTPLHGVLGVNNLLKETINTDLQKKYTRMIDKSAESLLFLVNDILDIAKMEAGQFTIESISFDLFHTIDKALQPLIIKIREKKLDFELLKNVSSEIRLIGDPHRLTQIITNLVNNAIKFTSEGIIRVKITLNFEDNCYKLNFAVQDSGIGITDDLLSTIFEAYTQADDSHGRLYGGTGLGLSIVKKLVEAQNGTISVSSELNKGSLFSFQLNYKKAQEFLYKKEDVKHPSLAHFKDLRILIVEDNLVNQMIAKHLLDKCYAKYDLAESGDKAISFALNNVYDVILMDIQLPDMSGEEITYMIRNCDQLEKAQVPIIAITANAMKGDSAKYLKSGMNGYLSKPYSAIDLYNQIALALNIPVDGH